MSSLSLASTMDQGIHKGLSVMVTITLSPTMLYSPLSMPCEKRPDLSSPTKATLFSFAAFLTLASSDLRSSFVCMPKVLAMVSP